jgi:hypothetical protein
MSIRGIAFVPASGMAKEMRFFGVKLPGIFSWRIFHFLLGLPGVKVKYTDQLNQETISRLARVLELYNRGVFGEIFIAGGYAKGAIYTTSQLMKQYLTCAKYRACFGGKILRCVKDEKIIHVGKKSSDSMGHARELVDFLADLPEETIYLYIITSNYHMVRAEKAIHRELCARKINKEIVIENYPVMPPNNVEVNFNRCMEPIIYLRDKYRMSHK